MATLTIKNIPDELYINLKNQAVEHHRSINSEVIVCLEQVLGSKKTNSDRVLQRIRHIRARLPKIKLNEKELKKAKNEGRP